MRSSSTSPPSRRSTHRWPPTTSRPSAPRSRGPGPRSARSVPSAGPGESVESEDITNHDSPGSYREKVPTLIDGGEVGLEIIYSHEAGQAALRAAFAARTVAEVILELPDTAGTSGTTFTFQAFISQVGLGHPRRRCAQGQHQHHRRRRRRGRRACRLADDQAEHSGVAGPRGWRPAGPQRDRRSRRRQDRDRPRPRVGRGDPARCAHGQGAVRADRPDGRPRRAVRERRSRARSPTTWSWPCRSSMPTATDCPTRRVLPTSSSRRTSRSSGASTASASACRHSVRPNSRRRSMSWGKRDRAQTSSTD